MWIYDHFQNSVMHVKCNQHCEYTQNISTKLQRFYVYHKLIYVILNHICAEIISKSSIQLAILLPYKAFIIPIQACSPETILLIQEHFKDITNFSRLSIFKPPYILPCIITFRLMRSHFEPHINWKKSLVRLFKVSILGLGRAINRWFNFGIINYCSSIFRMWESNIFMEWTSL